MRCSEIQTRLTEARYGDTPLDEEERAHVAGCDACKAIADESAGLDALLATETDDVPGPGFDTRFFARLEEERASKPVGLWHRWRWALAGTATLVAGTAGVLFVVATSNPPPLATDLELAMNLDLMTDLEVVEDLEEVEVFELFARVDDETLDALLNAEGEQP